MPNIIVVGAGVSGLTTALLLSKNAEYNVVLLAKHMPGDLSIEYTSPWAGADVVPGAGREVNKWEKVAWPEFVRLCSDVPEAGIHSQDCVHYVRDKDPKHSVERETGEIFSLDPWWKELMPGFKILGKSDVPPEYDSGYGYRSMCINVPIYLAWLVGQCRKHGVVFERAELSHITDAAEMHPSGKADVVVNCTGLLSCKLGGVMDPNVVPVRGQTVIVRNDSGMIMSVSGTDDPPEESCYMMPRAAGGGTLIGGLHQVGNWESQPDPHIALRMMQRAVKVCPTLTDGKGVEALSIISVNVGLRPLRYGGVRIEREQIDGIEVVHNYGHAGKGYQYSYGTSGDAVKLVGEVLGVAIPEEGTK